jgi:N-acetylglutamate synthase-like GNAT family acetyltransferase
VDTVRLANATDAQGITQLQISNWQTTHSVLAQLLDPEDVESEWAQAITFHGDLGRVLVCERNGTLVGVIAIEFQGELGLISLLEVAPAVRRQLIGARLLNAVADIAVQAGCQHMSLWLNDDHSGAKSFLESMGWGRSGATRTVSADLGDLVDSTDDKGAQNSPHEFTEQQCEFTTSLST